MLRRYPTTLRWRQALPPVFTASLAILFVLSFAWRVFGWLLLFEFLAYFIILMMVSLKNAVFRKEYFLMIGLPLAVAVMHLAWGAGFLWSIFSEKWIS